MAPRGRPRGAATTAMGVIAEERQRRGRPRAATNPKGTWGLRPHASFLVVNDTTISFPPRASPGTRKPRVRGPCSDSDRLLSPLILHPSGPVSRRALGDRRGDGAHPFEGAEELLVLGERLAAAIDRIVFGDMPVMERVVGGARGPA